MPPLCRFTLLASCAALLGACSMSSADTLDASDGEVAENRGGSPGGSPPTTMPADVVATLDLPDPPYAYAEPELPAHFETAGVRALDNTPADNPVTDDGATLGRVLFYDVSLSQNRTVACASCHAQDLAFGDHRTASEGFAGGLTGRNSMSLMNVRYYRNGRFFWDERAETLEDQVLGPIQDEVEMGLTLDELVTRVEEQPYYGYLFEQAFGDAQVSTDRIARALAQYVRSLLSYRSRYDDGVAAAGAPNEPFEGFSMQENQGKALFFGRARCATCHVDNGGGGPPGAGGPNQATFFMPNARNNGLDGFRDPDDDGVAGQTGRPQDSGRFKSPSLRNVALTAPYMHDGRMETLAEVIEHYDSGVQPHPNLDPRLRNPQTGAPLRLGLTPAERSALEAFLGTLTDTSFLQDPRFSDPFR